jgi:hypothetical protein
MLLEKGRATGPPDRRRRHSRYPSSILKAALLEHRNVQGRCSLPGLK